MRESRRSFFKALGVASSWAGFIGGWKKQALAGLPDIFGNGREQMRQQADN
jgi:hypothetical protein